MYDYGYGYDYGYDYSYADVDTAAGILGGFAAFGVIIMVVSMVISVLMIVSQWKIYKKAGKQGWECLIPIYNIIVLLQIVELPMWYIALFFVPFANIYAMFKIYIELAHKFGKSTGFGVLTVFFNVICLPILAFSKNCVYNGGNVQNNGVNMQNNQFTPNNMNTFQNPVPTPEPSTSGQQPFVFDQNINTDINPIPTVQNDFNNPTPQMNTVVEPTPVVNNVTPEPVNVVPMPAPVAPEPTPQPVVEPMNTAAPLNVIPGAGQNTEMSNPNNNNNPMM